VVMALDSAMGAILIGFGLKLAFDKARWATHIKSSPAWLRITLAKDVLEASAAFLILIYLGILWFSGRWNQKLSIAGINYSLLTGICVAAGTIAFFLLFQKGGPLSSVPAILAGGAAIMVIVGILFFRDPLSWQRIAGVAFAIVGLFLLRK
jgi:bacterial/archaeal transporter family protein